MATTIPDGSEISPVTAFRVKVGRTYQKLLDDTTPHTIPRWGFSAFLLLLYILRVWYLGGWYIVSYALGIYMLNLLIGFLSPKIDPDVDSEGAALPVRSDDEFRPFIRRLPEFKFWYVVRGWCSWWLYDILGSLVPCYNDYFRYSITRALLISIVCTFFSFLNIPVFWPILLIYFIALFVVTMKNQIKHMIRHKYIPFNIGKKQYRGRKDDK